MSKKDKVKEFILYWRSKSDIPIETEYRPQKVEYDSTETDLKYRAWLKSKGYNDYRADMAIVFKDRGPPNGIYVEFDGGGQFSHRGAGAQRDRKKGNQALKQGFLFARFPVTALKNMDYVLDEILMILEYWRPNELC